MNETEIKKPELKIGDRVRVLEPSGSEIGCAVIVNEISLAEYLSQFPVEGICESIDADDADESDSDEESSADEIASVLIAELEDGGKVNNKECIFSLM
jgi:hypothetical protein